MILTQRNFNTGGKMTKDEKELILNAVPNVMCIICHRVRIGDDWVERKASEREEIKLPKVPCPKCRPAINCI